MELRTLNNRFLFNDNEIKNKNISEEKIEILKAGIPELRNEYKILEDILRAEDTIFRKPFIELLTKENSWITRQRKYLDEKFEKLTPGTIWKKITNTLLLRKITEDDIRDDIRHMTESKEALEYIKILIGRFDYYLTKKAKEYIIKIMGKSIIVGDKKKKELEMTLFASEFDALTKLPDNRKYKKDIKKIISEFKRYEKTFSLAIFDIDKFKTFNDDYGHATGDVVLATVAKIASEHTRESDTLYRYGGEEFTAIFPNTDKKGAMKACEAIRKAIEKKSTPVMDIINETQEKSKKKRDEITVSIGVSDTEDLSLQSIDNNDEAGIAMFELADKALYRAKETGRNKVIGYRKAS